MKRGGTLSEHFYEKKPNMSMFTGTLPVGHDITLQLKYAVVLMNVCEKGILS